MVDMNMFAAGYGQNQPSNPLNQTNPMAGSAAPQKATNMPGAVGDIVAAIKGGYDSGMKNRAGQPRVADLNPMFSGGTPGAPLDLTPKELTTGLGQVPAGGIPGPVAAMPPMAPPMPPPMPGATGANALPFAEGTQGLPGIGDYVGPPASGMGIIDIMQNSGIPAGGLASLFGGGAPSPQDLSMNALFDGGAGLGGVLGGWGMFG